jgi:hypothetical protein
LKKPQDDEHLAKLSGSQKGSMTTCHDISKNFLLPASFAWQVMNC